MQSTQNIKKLLSNQKGVAAIEFALILPFLLLLLLGGFEITQFLLLNQKLDKVSYTITDVVSQNTSLTNAQLNQIMSASVQIMKPIPFQNEGVVILSSIYKNGNNAPVVRWQYKGGGLLVRSSRIGNVNQNAILPNELTLNDKDNVIIAEVYYTYTPIFSTFSQNFLSATDLYKVAIFKPRLGDLTTPPT